MRGIYVHVPFCLRKCPYCDFYSVVSDNDMIEKYVKAIKRNINEYRGVGVKADTLYFGGGTPSLLSVKQMSELVSCATDVFGLENSEITTEANPCSVDYEKLSGYKKAGINRISFGVQSSNDKDLCFLGRLHDFESAEKAVENAVKAGFENISCDVMLGLAGQSCESLCKTIDDISSLPINHISAYMLKIEKGTPFDCEKVKNSVADDDLLADMYLQTVGQLENVGFMQYEISNFAKNGFESKHNLKYWHGEEYLGFGPSAHSYFKNERYCCPSDLKSFVENRVSQKIILETNPDKLEEYLVLNLRLKSGIDVECIADNFGSSVSENIKDKLELFEKNGLCENSGSRYYFTPKGFLVSNEAIAEVLESVM